MSGVPPDALLTAQEVARQLGVADKTIRRWIAEGRLPAEKHGAVYAIRLGDALEVAGPRSSRGQASTLAATLTHEREVAELRGRYLEAKDRIAALESELERERCQRVELELRIAAAPLAA
jgi:excisionase family DNA binding protein